ncbi:MAG: hypothetical protein HQK51_20570, partial [Oligoflexia bacterium]|nr:hypothetical protein [Oligoflexia bacterium]
MKNCFEKILQNIISLKIVLLIPLVFYSCIDIKKNFQFINKGIYPVSEREGVLLGMGYDSLMNSLKGLRCFENFQTKIFPKSVASLRFENHLSALELSKLLSGAISVGVPIYPGITATGGIDFKAEFAQTDYRDTFVLHFEGILEEQSLYFNNNEKLSFETQNIYNMYMFHPEILKNVYHSSCGDEYINSIQYGITMTAIMSIEYTSSFDKKVYGGQLKAELAGGIVSVTGRTEFQNLLKKSHASIKLYITQGGGQPLAIFNDLLIPASVNNDSNFPEGILPFTNSGFHCSSNSSEPCLKKLEVIAQYMANLKNQ